MADGERLPVLVKDVEREQLEVCNWRASERPVDTDSFRIAQESDAPFSRHDNDTPIVTEEHAIVCKRLRHNDVLCSARMLSPHPDPLCKSVVSAFSSARQGLIADV